MAKQPTERTLKWLREKLGYTAEVVERYNSFTKQRNDLFGCIDIVGMKPGSKGCLGVQATSGSNHAARVNKILTDFKVAPKARLWLSCGNKLWVVSWKKMGAKGKRKTWQGRCDAITLADFERHREAS